MFISAALRTSKLAEKDDNHGHAARSRGLTTRLRDTLLPTPLQCLFRKSRRHDKRKRDVKRFIAYGRHVERNALAARSTHCERVCSDCSMARAHGANLYGMEYQKIDCGWPIRCASQWARPRRRRLPSQTATTKHRPGIAPILEVHLAQSSEPPDGELGTATVAPALTNAVLAATGYANQNTSDQSGGFAACIAAEAWPTVSFARSSLAAR